MLGWVGWLRCPAGRWKRGREMDSRSGRKERRKGKEGVGGECGKRWGWRGDCGRGGFEGEISEGMMRGLGEEGLEW